MFVGFAARELTHRRFAKHRKKRSSSGKTLDGQTDCFKIDRICLSGVNPSAVRWLGKTLDGQTNCFKIDRICLSVVNPSTRTCDGQTNRIIFIQFVWTSCHTCRRTMAAARHRTALLLIYYYRRRFSSHRQIYLAADGC